MQRIQSYLEINNPRAWILFQIGLATGYRGSDLVRLTVKNAKEAIESGKFSIIEQKIESIAKSNAKKNGIESIKYTKFTRDVYIPPKLKDVLEKYIQNKHDYEFLYVSQKGTGKNIRRDSLGKEFSKAAKACGINVCVGTHTPRKTYGYIQYNSHDKDLTFVQELFGHSSPKVTRFYIGIDEEEKQAAAELMDKYM